MKTLHVSNQNLNGAESTVLKIRNAFFTLFVVLFFGGVWGQNADVSISTAASGVTNGAWTFSGGVHTFTPSANNAVVSRGDIQNRLLGSGVTAGSVRILTACASCNQTGNVTQASTATITAATTSTTQLTFTITAEGSITISQAINLTPATGGNGVAGRPATNVTLTAGSSGSVTISAAINCTGGSAGGGGGNVGGIGGSFTVSGSSVIISQNITTNGGTSTNNNAGANAGAISITGTNGVTISGNLSAIGSNSSGNNTTGGNGGNVTISTNGNDITTGGANDGVSGVINNSGGTTNSTHGTVTKSGTGTLVLSGANTYNGATNITAGVLNIQNASALGTTTSGTTVSSGAALQLQGAAVGAEALTLNGTGVSADGALRFISGTNSWAGLITLASASRINADAGTNTIDVASGNAITGTFNLSVGGAGSLTIADPIATSSGTLTKDGTGTLTLGGANTYTGSTTVTAGVLRISAAERIANASNLILNGGTFSTGSGAGLTETLGTLQVTENSTIQLGTGNHSLVFNNSSAVSWTAGKTLTITGWTGAGGSTGNEGKVFFGTTNGGLSTTQQGNVVFSGFVTPTIMLNTGECVPDLPQCSGTPNAGTAVSDKLTVCGTGGTTNGFTLSLVGATQAGSINYQWQSSSDGINFTNIVGANSSILSSSHTAKTYYRCVLTCQGQSSNSSIVLVNYTATCYCLPTYSSGGTNDRITNVTLSVLNDTPPPNTTPFYFDRTVVQNAIPDLTPGTSVNISLSFGSDANQFSRVWIDFNSNGVFETSESFSLGTNAGANGTAIIPITIPLGALSGITRLRIRGADDVAISNTQACGASSSNFGQALDYFVNIIELTGCAGTPNPGNTSADLPAVCTGTNFNLSLETPLTELDYAYQWQYSLDGLTGWTNVATGGNSATCQTQLPTAANYYYRCNVTCLNSGLSATSSVILIYYDCSTYCTSNLHSGSGTCISRVQVGSIDNSTSTSCALPSYSIQTATTTFYPGTNYPITVTTGASAIVSVWVDFNKNSIFEASEWVQVYTTGTTGTATISVPPGALLGATRMRVRSRAAGNTNGSGNACTQFASGETEDYIIVICANPTISSQPSNQTVCVGDALNFSVTASTPVETGNALYQWQVNTGSDFVNITDNANYSGTTSATLSISSYTSGFNNYQYRCIVSNGCGGTITSDAATLTVNEQPQTAMLLSPADNATGLNASTVTLTWSGNTANTGYKLYFGTDNTPTNILDGFDVGNVASYITGSLQPFTEYYWRVVAYNSNCGEASSSPIFKFTTGAPGPLISSFSPTSVCTSNGASISINGANFTGATSVTINGIALTNFTVVSDILITAVLPSGVTTGKIEVITPTGSGLSFTNFIVYENIPASCATLQLPANAATDENSGGVTLTWSAVPNTANYDIYFGTNSTPGLLLTQNATLTSYFTGILSANTTYYWRIVPKNDCGEATGCTTTFSFTTGAPCLTQTSQADFQAGTLTGVDILQSPNNVILAGNGTQSLNLSAATSSAAIPLTNTTFYGQIFRPTQAGYISQVDLYSRCSSCSGANPNIIVEIRDVVGGQPGNTVLASTTIPGFSSALEWRSVTFSAPLAVLNTTTDYALVVRASSARTAGNYDLVRDNNSNTYGGNTYNYFTTNNSGSTWANSGYDYGFRTFMTPVTYVASGSIESSLIDAGSSVHWTDLSWGAQTPSGTEVKFQVAFSNSSSGPFDFIGPDGTNSSFFTSSVADLSLLGNLSQGKRYFKYKAFLATTNSSNTAVLSEVTACYCNPPIVSLINPVTSVCANQSVTYETQAGNTNYQWFVSGGTITSGGSSTDHTSYRNMG
jgi:autotransporter-associated beta strand protein